MQLIIVLIDFFSLWMYWLWIICGVFMQEKKDAEKEQTVKDVDTDLDFFTTCWDWVSPHLCWKDKAQLSFFMGQGHTVIWTLAMGDQPCSICFHFRLLFHQFPAVSNCSSFLFSSLNTTSISIAAACYAHFLHHA